MLFQTHMTFFPSMENKKLVFFKYPGCSLPYNAGKYELGMSSSKMSKQSS